MRPVDIKFWFRHAVSKRRFLTSGSSIAGASLTVGRHIGIDLAADVHTLVRSCGPFSHLCRIKTTRATNTAEPSIRLSPLTENFKSLIFNSHQSGVRSDQFIAWSYKLASGMISGFGIGFLNLCDQGREYCTNFIIPFGQVLRFFFTDVL